jgi:hypothetical protein
MKNFLYGAGIWMIVFICVGILVSLIGLTFHLLGPIFSCILVFVLVIVYSVVRYRMVTRG